MTDDAFRIVVTAGVGLAALAFLIQAGVMIALYRIVRKTQPTAVRMSESNRTNMVRIGRILACLKLESMPAP